MKIGAIVAQLGAVMIGAIGFAVVDGFLRMFAVCEPAVKDAAEASTLEANQKAAERLKKECVPSQVQAIGAHTRLVDGMIADAAAASNRLAEENTSSIVITAIIAGIGLLISIIVAMLIGVK